MGAGDLTEATDPVTVGAVFERFPASVRGAVVVRGEDREPHQVRLLGIRVVQAHDLRREVRPVAVEPVTVDVAPHKDVLVPFDIPFSGLDPGWYCVVAEVEVDGITRARGPQGGGKRFVVPWPPEEVRRGELKPKLAVGKSVVERVELQPDCALIRWKPTGEDTELRVSAGNRRLPVIEASDDPKTGVRTTVTHPVPRRATELRLEVAGKKSRGKASAKLDLD